MFYISFQGSALTPMSPWVAPWVTLITRPPFTRLHRSLHSTPWQEHHWRNTCGLKIRPEKPGPSLLRKSEPSDDANLTKCALWLLPEGTAGLTDHGVSYCEEGKTIFPTGAVADSHTSSQANQCLRLLAVSRACLAPGHRPPPSASWPRLGWSLLSPCRLHLCPGFLLCPPLCLFLFQCQGSLPFPSPILLVEGN